MKGNIYKTLSSHVSCYPFHQATTLLTMDKYSAEDIPTVNSTCFKLNSLQLQALLQNYHCAPDEPFVPAVSAARRPRGGPAAGHCLLREMSGSKRCGRGCL